MMYSKHPGFVVTVPRLIVKLTPADFDARTGAVAERTLPVLQVTLSGVPSAAFCVMPISLFAVTAVVSTTQVPVLAFVAHENIPAAADVHDTTDGFAAVPVAAQFVPVLYVPD